MDSRTLTPAQRLRLPLSPIAIVWAATIALVAGFALLAITWAKVSTLTIVAAQLPYLVSGGMIGLGLIIVGAAGVVVWSRRVDDEQRLRQTEELLATLRDIRSGLGELP